MKVLIILFLLLFIIFVSFSKSKKNIETFIKSNKALEKYLGELTGKVDKLEYLLHKSAIHNKIGIKIKQLEKKYNKAYAWYKNNNIKDMKMAKSISGSIMANLT